MVFFSLVWVVVLGVSVTYLPFLALGTSCTATFDEIENGIGGTVVIDSGIITVDLDLSSVNTTMLPNAGCINDTISYHLHTMWAYNDSMDRIGSDDCGSTYTSGHYDPYMACGSASANINCDNNGGCINSTYDCNITTDPYSCESGDWSSKYGKVKPDIYSMVYASHSNYFELSCADIAGMGMSVVFHCGNTGSRAFCAPFIEDNSGSDEERNPSQTSTYAPIGVDIDMGVHGTITMYNNGTFSGVNLDFSSFGTGSCGSDYELKYAIFNSWNSSEDILYDGNCTRAVVGDFWDPTHQCPTGCGWSDSPYCVNNRTCNTTTYSCNVTMDNFSCAPGDLSGKYGTVSTAGTTPNINSNVGVLPAFSQLSGKSLVVYCGDYCTKKMCVSLGYRTYRPTMDPTSSPTDEPSVEPTSSPTKDPTIKPTEDPTMDPTMEPTDEPTRDPTMRPTEDPTMEPTEEPMTEYTTTEKISSSNNKKVLAVMMMMMIVVVGFVVDGY